MKKSRVKFIVFIVVWLGILNYLILNKARISSSVLSDLSGPVSKILTGSVVGSGSGNPFIVLIILNVIIAVLFSISYFNWEAKKKRVNKKKG